MKVSQKIWLYIAIGFGLLVSLYWFSVREELIARNCDKSAWNTVWEQREGKSLDVFAGGYRFYFEQCKNKRILF